MWYAVQVFTGEEERTITFSKILVEEELITDIFYPQKEVMKRYKGVWNKERLPIFPGYIFAVTDSVDRLYEAFKRVPKLVKILGAGKVPVALTEEETTFLHRITNADHVAEVSVGFIEGDKLTVESGPLAGMEGMVKKIDRHRRTAVLEVEMFGRKVRMSLGLEVLGKL